MGIVMVVVAVLALTFILLRSFGLEPDRTLLFSKSNSDLSVLTLARR